MATALLCSSVFGQNGSPSELQLRSAVISLNKGTFEIDAQQNEAVNGHIYRFVQFYNTPTSAQRKELSILGWRFLNYVGKSTYLVALPADLATTNIDQNSIRSIVSVPPSVKVHPHLIEGPYPEYALQNGGLLIKIRAQKDISESKILELATDLKVLNADERGVVALIKESEIQNIAAKPWVNWLGFIPEPGQPEDTPGRTLHRSNLLYADNPLGRQYTGEGVNMAVNDDGEVGPHIDFKGRVNQDDVRGDLTGSHGDMTAGIAGGAGNLNPNIRGMAPYAYMHIRDYDPDMSGILDLHQDSAVMIISTSYSNGCNAGYQDNTEQVDDEIYNNNSLTQVFSAGNSNTLDCGYGAGTQWGNVTGGHKIAKNAITVANVTADDVIAMYSSRGPASDGRIKPDIAANGNAQASTSPNNTYFPNLNGGTSAACPSIAGVLAQMYHAYRELNGGNDPNSGLMKACLLNTAEDLGNEGPDFIFGYGRVNAINALRILEDNRYMSASVGQGATTPLSINVPAGVAQMKVMLYWVDPAGAIFSSVHLVNDLNLEVTDPGATTYLPLVLDHTPDPLLLDLPAIQGVDHLNNMEQVVIQNPTAGSYSVSVDGFDVPFGPQEFFIVYEYVYDEIELIHPIGGEGLVPGETEWIRWDALNKVDDITVDLSGDNGISWTTIATVAGEERYTLWTVPDSLTGEGLFRVTQNGSTDQSGSNFTIMYQPTGLEIAWQCPDSLALAWNAQAGATGYIPYFLGTSQMEAMPMTTDTSFVFYGFDQFEEDWFSVQALGPNNAKSRRAVAIPKPNDLVNCVQQHDMAILEILSPANYAMNCQNDDAVVVSALVQNAGSDTIFNWTTRFNFNGGSLTSTPSTQTLAPGDSTTVVFPPTNLDVMGNIFNETFNELNVWVEHAMDDLTYNDTAYGGVTSFYSQVAFPWGSDLEDLNNCEFAPTCAGQNCELENDLINLENVLYDDMDWRIDSAGTPTPGTGPSVDHTLGTAQGHYLYLSSADDCSFQESQLMMPCQILPQNDPQTFSFWYHMFGAGQGELHVDLMSDLSWELDVVPPVIGDQGNNWYPILVPLDAWLGQAVTLRVRAITGHSNLSDMALDDFGIGLLHIGIDEVSNTGIVNVHPNPGNGRYVVDLGSYQNAVIEVLDMSGKLIKRQEVSGQNVEMDIEGAPSGIYMLHVTGDNIDQRIRLVRL